MREEAEWRPTEHMSFAAYCARQRQPPHPLVSSRFFWRHFYYLDTMHAIDCKGVAASILGSICSTFMSDDRLGPNRAARLALINARKNSWYDHHPGRARLPDIKSSSIYLDGWAELHGPSMKAAMTRKAAPFFQELVQEFLSDGSEHHRWILEVVSNLNKLYACLEDSPMFLSDDALSRLRTNILDLGIAYQRLRQFACDANRLEWGVKPKLHKLQHIPFFAASINPRCVHCYGAESLIGTTCQVWKACVDGRFREHVQMNVLVKRLLGLLLRFEL